MTAVPEADARTETQPEPLENRMYTLNEAARLCRVSLAQIHRLVNAGRIRTGGFSMPSNRKKKCKRIPYDEMMRILKEGCDTPARA